MFLYYAVALLLYFSSMTFTEPEIFDTTQTNHNPDQLSQLFMTKTARMDTEKNLHRTASNTKSPSQQRLPLDQTPNTKTTSTPIIARNFQDLAKQQFENTWLFKDSRQQKYLERTSKLPQNIKNALLNPNSLRNLDNTDLEQLQSQLKQQLTVENKQSGNFWQGTKSGTLIKQLQSLQKTVRDTLNSTSDTLSSASKTSFTDTPQETQHEHNERTLIRNQAKPGSVNDYVADNAFTAIKNPKQHEPQESFDISKVSDDKAQVLNQQISTLEARLPKTAAIEKELTDLYQQRSQHYKDLYQETLTRIDALEKEERQIDRDFKNADAHSFRKTTLTKAIARAQKELQQIKSSILEQNNYIQDLTQELQEEQEHAQRIKEENVAQIQTIQNQIATMQKDPANTSAMIQAKQSIINELVDQNTQATDKVQRYTNNLEHEKDALARLQESQTELTQEIHKNNAELSRIPTKTKDQLITQSKANQAKLQRLNALRLPLEKASLQN